MLVTLAYPYLGHDPDDTIEVTVAEGRRLIAGGVARLPAGGGTPDPVGRYNITLVGVTEDEYGDVDDDDPNIVYLIGEEFA